jgi:hypothetical protein
VLATTVPNGSTTGRVRDIFGKERIGNRAVAADAEGSDSLELSTATSTGRVGQRADALAEGPDEALYLEKRLVSAVDPVDRIINSWHSLHNQGIPEAAPWYSDLGSDIGHRKQTVSTPAPLAPATT